MEWNEEHREAVASDRASSTFESPKYAGLIIRFIASLVDGIIFIILMIIPILIFAFMIVGSRGSSASIAIESIAFELFAIGVSWLYFAYFESSRSMATPGKTLCGLKVTDMDGRQITFQACHRTIFHERYHSGRNEAHKQVFRRHL